MHKKCLVEVCGVLPWEYCISKDYCKSHCACPGGVFGSSPLNNKESTNHTRKAVFDSVSQRAWAIQEERARSYGEEWQQRSPESHLHGAIYKLERAFYNKTDETKRIDDLLDARNMIDFAIGQIERKDK